MRRLPIIAPLLALLVVACSHDPAAPVGARPYAECAEPVAYVPTAGWRSICPGAVGIDTAHLRYALDDVRGQMPTLQALVVARKGYIVLEAYWNGTRASTPLDIRSVTKAVTASTVAAEIQDGKIAGMDVPLTTYWSWLATTDDARRATLQVRHLLDLSAGYDMDGFSQSVVDVPSRFLTRPLRWDPGTHWEYDEGLYDVLSALVHKVDTRGLRDAAREELLAPLGIASAASRWPANRVGDAYGASGLRLTAREMLSLGELYRRDGVWDGQQVLPANWVAPMRVRRAGLADNEEVWFRAWRQVVLAGHLAIYTIGYGGQYIVVVPDLDLVVAAGSKADVAPPGWPPVLSLVRDHIIPGTT